MYSQHPHPAFKKPFFYIITDLLFLICSILFIVGDQISIFNHDKYNALMFFKPLPIWIMIYQLWSLRDVYKVTTIMVALFFSSLGDIFLLAGQGMAFFGLGAGSFLIGHVINVYAFVRITEKLAENRVSIGSVMRNEPLFIIIWIVLVTISFWSISLMVWGLKQEGHLISIMILGLYGSCLVLLNMGALFYFFTTLPIRNMCCSGVLLVVGALVFLSSDNFLAHGKFNTNYPFYTDKDHPDPHKSSINSYLIMITYYLAQFLITKAIFLYAATSHDDLDQTHPRENSLAVRDDLP